MTELAVIIAEAGVLQASVSARDGATHTASLVNPTFVM